MTLKEVAQQYHSWGLSVVPCDKDKRPKGEWKISQYERREPNGNFNNSWGIGIICGAVSGNVEVIDIDLKYDITGTLYQRIKEAIKHLDFVRDFVVEETQNSGIHFFYKCDIIGANQAFAKRHTTEGERVLNPKEKTKVIIETRGEGGFIVTTPSPNYKIVSRKSTDFSMIPTITIEQRLELIEILKTFDETDMWKPKEEVVKKLAQQPKRIGVSVFEAYNLGADIPSLLEEYDWKYVEKQGDNMRFLRPNGSGRTSADWHVEMRLLHVFTSSTEFEPSKSYNPVQIYTTLKYGNRDKESYALSAKDFKEMGYGDSFDPIEIQSQLRVDELDLNHLADIDEAENVLDEIRSGNFAMGVGIGLRQLDEKWVYKVGQFNVINGHANVGKTTFLLWWFVMLSKKHGYNWLICSTENDTWEFMKMIIEFYTGKIITDIGELEYEDAKVWAKEHFTIFSNERTYTYKDILSISQNEMKVKPYAGLLVDPFSGLEYIVEELKTFGAYTYHYRSANAYRMFCKKTLISIFLIIHPPTEATRRVKDGKIEAPNAADAEYGNMWFNRCWNYLTAHRHTNGMDWDIMYIYVRKIKNLFSGGGITIEPIKLRMVKGGRGYVDEFDRQPTSVSQSYYETDNDEIAPF